MVVGSMPGLARAESPVPPCFANNALPSAMAIPANVPALAVSTDVTGHGFAADAAGDYSISLHRMEGVGWAEVPGEQSVVDTADANPRFVGARSSR